MSYHNPAERKYILVFLVYFNFVTSLSEGQEYNLTGSSQAAVLGQPFTWTCGMFIPAGETLNAVDFYRNEYKSGSVGMNNGNCVFVSHNPRYTYQCLSAREFSLTIPAQNMTEFEQGTVWHCAYYGIGRIKSPDVTLRIANKPQISITTSNPYRITEGQTATLISVVSAANPNTITEWRWIKTDQPNTILYRGPNYTIPSIEREHSGTYRCTATNSLGTSEPATVQVDVLYKPQVSITTSNTYRISEGHTATLTCIVTAANPSTITEWKWIKTDQPINVFYSGPNYTISNIQRGQSGTYMCTATNPIGTSEPATVQVDIQYRPQVNITTLNPYRITEGQTATLTCVVIAANPNTITEWRWIKTDQPNNVLYRGPNYTISNIQRRQSGTYRCTATNSVRTSEPTTVQVDVQYGPAKVTLFPDVKVINKTENETVTPITCSAVCNPVCSFTWTRAGMSAVVSRILDLGQLKRTERGAYTCTASNSINSFSTTISVIVNYPPNIKTFQMSNGQTFEEASFFNITCTVDSFPFSDIYITNIDTGEVQASGGPIESLTYREPSAKCYQTANYSCHSQNVYGSATSSKQQIFILCKPRASDGKSNNKIGIKTGEGLNISTNFIGYPLPQISWTFKKNITDGPSSVDKQQIYSVQLNVSTIQAGLMKETLNQEEFGYYVVTATTPGKPSQISTLTYHVFPQRKPNPPYNISVNCKVSRGTALVNWEPGFDGGAAQTFLASYRTRMKIQKNTTEKYLYPNATLTNLKDDTEYSIKIIASNTHGETMSEEEKTCKTIDFQAPQSYIGGIIGGAFGGVVFVVLVVGLIFINRKYQIKCHISERKFNPSSEIPDTSDNILETFGLQSEKSVQYEELNQISRDQENTYDALNSPSKKRIYGETTKDLQSQKEENKYEELSDPTSGKETTYNDSEILFPGNVYVNMSFK